MKRTRVNHNNRTRVFALSVMLGASTPGLADRLVSSEATCEVGGVVMDKQLPWLEREKTIKVYAGPGPVQNDPKTFWWVYRNYLFTDFPIDVFEPVWDVPPAPTIESPGAWCYANETGRLRTSVLSDHRTPPGTPDLEGVSGLSWEATYLRDSEEMPSFTVNRSWVETMGYYNGADEVSSLQHKASMGILVEVNTPTNAWGDVEFMADLSLHSIVESPYFYADKASEGRNQFYLEPGNAQTATTPQINAVPLQQDGRTARYEIPGFTQVIDLDYHGAVMGDTYTILYEMDASAAQMIGFEGGSEAYIGDPLDIGPGIHVETNHTRVAKAMGCRNVSEPGRYQYHDDGTVTDTRYGLMWRRCPLGAQLDVGANPGDPTDDTCLAISGAEVTVDWQTALQSASGELTGGFSDWRVPSVKELETLLESQCGTTSIDEAPFPDTPPAAFWSSTPNTTSGGGNQSWTVDFGNEDLRPLTRDGLTFARFVRTQADALSAPRPGVSVGSARAQEGDTGVSTLNIPVIMDWPIDQPIEFDVGIKPTRAEAGVDFRLPTTHFTLPAQSKLTYVPLEVIGDTDVEGNELIRLEITQLSAGAWLKQAQGNGYIDDDDGMLRMPLEHEALEGQNIDIEISLDKPAAQTVTADLVVIPGTALLNDDYHSVPTTLTIPAGASSVTLSIPTTDDGVEEADETLTIQLDNLNNARAMTTPTRIQVLIVDDDRHGRYAALNDTGITHCTRATLSGDYSCPVADYPGQDADFGRDLTQYDDSDGPAGFSFTKLDHQGNALVDQTQDYKTQPWDCVRDEVTGLFWEVKNLNGPDRLPTNYYTWFNNSGLNDGGEAGSQNGGTCQDGADCDTSGYVDYVNSIGLCGYNDWRVPQADELFNLVNIGDLQAYGGSGLAANYFPGHASGREYWTGTPDLSVPSLALTIRIRGDSFGSSIDRSAKTTPHSLRLVRGGRTVAELQ